MSADFVVPVEFEVEGRIGLVVVDRRERALRVAVLRLPNLTPA